MIAFEPDPLNFAALKEHVALNKLEGRIELIRAVVGANEGHVRFCSGKGAYSFVTAIPTADSCLIDCVTLDQVFTNMRLDILKIDVEGYEEEVLKGSIDLLRTKSRRPRLICIELHPWAWQRAGVQTSGESLLGFLGRCGYRAFDSGWRAMERIDGHGEIVAVAAETAG